MSLTINTQPSQTEVLFDADPKIIEVTSSNGSDHYFRFRISSEGVTVREQAWSKQDANTVRADLVNLYRNTYDHNLQIPTTSGIIEVPAIIKEAKVTITEFNLETDAFVQSNNGGTYKIHKSVAKRSVSETANTDTVAWLDVMPNESKVTKDDIIQIPFVVNDIDPASTIFTLTLSAGLYNFYSSEHIVNAGTTYYAVIDLSKITLNHRKDLLLSVNGAGVTLSRKLTLIPWSAYPKRTLWFMNKFGLWQPVYFFGSQKEEHNYNRLDYELQDDTYETFEVDTDTRFTVNTGTLSQKQLPIVEQLCKSLDIRLLVNDILVPCKFINRRSTGARDRVYGYNENLAFSVKPSQL